MGKFNWNIGFILAEHLRNTFENINPIVMLSQFESQGSVMRFEDAEVVI